jgi:hypothetical protein
MMANFYAACRTNYFKVKDDDAFIAAMSEIPGLDVGNSDDGFYILGDDPDGAGWPNWVQDDEGNEIEIDLPLEVSKYLADGEVAIFMESGAEKLRYIVGYAVAINSQGEQVSIGLNDIYDMARGLTDRPQDVTVAEY